MADVTDEGMRLAAAAAEQDVPIRIMGGVAVFARCPSAVIPQLARSYGDVDFLGLSKARGQITDFFEANGYVGDKMFNALHGAQRLNFMDPVRGRPLDLIFDRFAMCHTIDLRDRLLLEPVTIPLADLLLTKLQVVELTDKDVRDLLVLLADHEHDLGRLQEVLGDDWGFEHTCRINLARVLDAAPNYGLPADFVDAVRGHATAIVEALDVGKKSLRWRARGAIGERVRWYEVPEEGRR
jgi:hypothetical protein